MNVLVTAGPTREALDPVRFISNRSSGKMGYAVAAAAARRGHEVRLVSGPVAIAPPGAATLLPVVTADEMLAAVRENVPWCDALIMAAAVGDWRPVRPRQDKLKRDRERIALRLERTPDILAAVRPLKDRRIFVGFAAETRDLEAEARRKLERKGLDLIVANDVSRPDSGFDADTNEVLLIGRDGSCRDLPLMPKARLAETIVAWVEERHAEATGQFPPPAAIQA